MSVLTTTFARAGFTATLVPPQPGGIYFDSVAVYNALTQVFAVQNGTDQDNLGSQLAQLYQIPTTGQALSLNPQPRFYPYGSYLGPVQAVWYGPTDSPGSFPTTLGALTGLIQWTPTVTLDPANAVYLVPGTSILAVVVSNASDTSETITVTGVQSGLVIGTGVLGGQSSIQINLEGGTNDSVFAVTSSGDITCTLSLIVGVPPVVNQGGGGGSVTFYASLTGPGQVDTPGDLTQAGGFTVTDSLGDGITLSSTGGLLTFSTTGDGNIELSTGSDGNVIIDGGQWTVTYDGGEVAMTFDSALSLTAPGSIDLTATDAAISVTGILTLATTGGNVRIEGVDSASAIVLSDSENTITINAAKIGFFSASPVAPQVSGGTLAGVIAGLVASGLFTS